MMVCVQCGKSLLDCKCQEVKYPKMPPSTPIIRNPIIAALWDKCTMIESQLKSMKTELEYLDKGEIS
jgi:hypothetical protein